MDKTFLNVPPAMVAYAMANGAQQDPDTKRYWVQGDVPPELLSFAPKLARQPMPEYGPSCPRCKAHMVRRTSKNNDFWGCSRFPKCRGSAPWEYKANQVGSSLVRTHLRGNAASTNNQCCATNIVVSQHLRNRWKAIVVMAAQQLGSIGAAEAWLNQPKVRFGSKTPAQIMATSAGCDKVESLLSSLAD